MYFSRRVLKTDDLPSPFQPTVSLALVIDGLHEGNPQSFVNEQSALVSRSVDRCLHPRLTRNKALDKRRNGHDAAYNQNFGVMLDLKIIGITVWCELRSFSGCYRAKERPYRKACPQEGEVLGR